jgi:integrase
MRLYRRKRADGTLGKVWWVYFVAPGGREVRQSTGQEDRKRADFVARDLERKACDPTYSAAHETTVASAIETFKAAVVQRGRSAGTMHMYDVKTAHLARLLGDETRLVKVDARMVDKYITTRLEEGASKNTVSKELVALRGLLKVARRRGEYDKEPSQVMPIAFDSGYTPRKRVLTREQAARLLVALPDDVVAWLAAALATGGRLSELARMRRADIDLAAGTMLIRGTKTAGSLATLPIVSATRPLMALALAAGLPGERFLPTWGRVRPILTAARAELGLPHFSPNDLRRTFVTWLVEAGVPLELVSKMSRHRDTRMVERVYGRASVGALGHLVERALKPRTTDVRSGSDSGDE